MADLLGGAGSVASIVGLLDAGVKRYQAWRAQVPDGQRPPETFFAPIRLPEHRNVVGREAEFKRLRTQLETSRGSVITSKGAVLQGEGGYGKTTLARHYAERTRDRYEGGCWVGAETAEQMFKDIMAFAAASFGFAVPEKIRDVDIQRVILEVDRCKARLLFVFDNVDDFRMVRDYLPQSETVDVIVTSREAGDVAGLTTMSLDVLDADGPDSPAVELLLQEAHQPLTKDRTDAVALAQELGGLPLALVIAGAMVRRGDSFASVLGDIERLIATDPDRKELYRDGVSKAVMVSFRKLSREAKGVANVCAWWAAEGLEPRLFYEAPGGQWWETYKGDVPEEWHGFLGDAAAVKMAFGELRDLSMLRGEGGGPQVMHRMTATVLRAAQEVDAERYARVAGALLKAFYPGGTKSVKNPDTWQVCRFLTAHAMALWSKARAAWRAAWGQPAWAAMGSLLHQCGLFLNSQEKRVEEIAAKRGSLEIKEASYGETERAIPLALGSLGLALSEIGESQEAEELLDRAVALDGRDRPGSEEHVVTLTLRAGLEFDRYRAGASDPGPDLGKADGLLEAARGFVDDPARGHSDAVKANVANEIGYLRRLQGRPADAAEAYERALALTPPGASNRAHRAAWAINSGATWLEAGVPERAEPLLREAYEICVKIFAQAPGHSWLRNASTKLANCLLVLDRRDGTHEREAEARELNALTGMDWAVRVQRANSLPLTPEEAAARMD